MSYNKLSISQKYVVLALAADAYLKEQSVVFHYFGPNKLKNYAKDLKKSGLKELVSDLHDLESEAALEMADSYPLFKRTYLISMIRSIRGLLAFGGSNLSGEPLLAAVSTVLGMNPPFPYDLNALQNELSSALGSHGYSSYDEFKLDMKAVTSCNSFELSDEYIDNLIGLLKDECIEKILPELFCGRRLIPVLKASKIKIVGEKKGQPECYYRYNGKGCGEIYLSPHHRKNRLAAIRTIMHELLPGHHLYGLYREMLHDLGYLGEESTIDLLYSAETPVNEGIAEIAPLFLMESFDAETRRMLEVMTSMEHYCKKLLYNVWYHRFVEQKMSEDEAASYIRRVGNVDDEKIDSWLKFVDEWRLYYPSYPVGITSIKKCVETASVKSLSNLYLPRTVSSILKMEDHYNLDADERRVYEKNRSETVLSGVDMMR